MVANDFTPDERRLMAARSRARREPRLEAWRLELDDCTDPGRREKLQTKISKAESNHRPALNCRAK